MSKRRVSPGIWNQQPTAARQPFLKPLPRAQRSMAVRGIISDSRRSAKSKRKS